MPESTTVPAGQFQLRSASASEEGKKRVLWPLLTMTSATVGLKPSFTHIWRVDVNRCVREAGKGERTSDQGQLFGYDGHEFAFGDAALGVIFVGWCQCLARTESFTTI
jgi:hypothetical protein